MKQIELGENIGELFFRKGDYFPDLAESFNSMINTIKEDKKEEQVLLKDLENLVTNLPSNPSSEQIEELKSKIENINKRNGLL